MDTQGTVVLKPTRLESLDRPGFRMKRPVVVLLTRRGAAIHAMISTPLIQATGETVEAAIASLRGRIVETYSLLNGKGQARTEAEAEDFDKLRLWLERDGAPSG